MPLWSSLSRRATEKSWKREWKNVWYVSYWSFVLYLHFLWNCMKLSSAYPINSGCRIPLLMVVFIPITWYYTDFLRRTWFDFAYCCKLIDKNSTLFVVTNLLSLPSCLTLYWFCKEKLSFDHCCGLMAQKLNIICNNCNYNVLFCYRFRDINLSLQSGC